MSGDADISAPASLLADRTRARVMIELADGRALPPSELAARAGVSRSTISEHLAKLTDAGLLAVEPGGRHRYYRLAGPAVAHAVEALAAIAPALPVRSLRQATQGEAIRKARTCYGHLAGTLGVQLADALQSGGLILRRGRGYQLTRKGKRRLSQLGLSPRALAGPPRVVGKACNDWSDRRPHIAGPLGVALTTRLFELAWIERVGTGRAVRLTPTGAADAASDRVIELDELPSIGAGLLLLW